MLLRFRGANHRSFRDEFEIRFTASKFNQGSGRSAELAEQPDVRYLPAVLVYGANGSGKSNSLLAIRWMRTAVLDSVFAWDRLPRIPREPFALDPDAAEETSLYEVDLVIDGDRYVYGFELSDERVEAEWLHAYPGGQARRQVWFERDTTKEDPYSFGDSLKGAKESLMHQTRPDALFLTLAAALNHLQLSPIHDWFKRNLWWVGSGHDREEHRRHTEDLYRNEEFQDRIARLLVSADLGLTGEGEFDRDGKIRLFHHAEGGPRSIDFAQESIGTQAWFAFVGALVSALDSGSVLLFDEMDASLHPLLVAEVLRLFRDPEANPHGAQLIASAHDASLLGSAHPVRPLTRDDVRITVKNQNGESEIYPLTDARPRPNEALDRQYLAGGYGGTPKVTTGGLARTLAMPNQNGACA